jgi:hypothetical protein
MQINRAGWAYFAVVENFLTAAECRQIIYETKEYNLTKVQAGMYEGWKTGEQIRDIGVPPQLQFKDKFDKLFDEFNEGSYKFKLVDKYSHFVNRYTENMILDWHRDEDESVEDLFKKTPANRLSASVFLNEDFEGGEFEIQHIRHWTPKTGTVIVLPSAQLHRGRLVTSGTKYNYTVWRKGERGA